MLETIRREYWDADEETIREIANLHASLIIEYRAGCSGFVCDNQKLGEMISEIVDAALKPDYLKQIGIARVGEISKGREAIKLRKEEKITLRAVKELIKENMAIVITILVMVALFSGAVIFSAIQHRKEYR